MRFEPGQRVLRRAWRGGRISFLNVALVGTEEAIASPIRQGRAVGAEPA